MGKKSTARAAAVAQFVAGAVDQVSFVVPRPGKGPHGPGPVTEMIYTSEAYWGPPRSTDRGPVSPEEKTSFNIEVFYTENDNELPTRFEVTVREVKS